MQLKIKIDDSIFRGKIARLNKPVWLEKAGNDLVEFLKNYHIRFKNRWKGERYMRGPYSGVFWANVVTGWQPPKIRGSKIVITNTFGLLKWKVEGGTITPKRARMLTIPLIPDAKGMLAAEFVAVEGTPLFRRGNALARRIAKRVENVYALVDSVTQPPWPGAMPDDETIKGVLIRGLKKQVAETLK